MQDNNDISEELMNSLKESISTNLGEYVILMPLSRGSGGFVFLIKGRKNKKQYALKVIWKGVTKPTFYAKIKNQITIHESLKNQYITQLLTKFQDFDNYYLVLEYCSEGDLLKYAKTKQKFSLSETKELALQIAKGINNLHQNNIVHRDLKPQNILITNEHKAKICDFGYSVKIKQNQKLKQIIGTLNYLAPEIVLKREYDKKIDCWSYGCILYFIATGNTPFNFQNLKEVVERVRGQTVEYPQSINPALKNLIEKLLVTDPNQRLSIKEVLNHPFFKNEPLTTTPITSIVNLPSATSISLSRTSSSRIIPTINSMQQNCVNIVKEIQYQIQQKTNKTNNNDQNNYINSNAQIDDKENVNTMNHYVSENLIKQPSNSLHKRTANYINMNVKRRQQIDKQIGLKTAVNMIQENRPLIKSNAEKLQPLNVEKLKAPVMETIHGKIKIDEDGITKFTDQTSLIFNVSPNGMIIKVKKYSNEKIYKLQDLPKKYNSIYKYCNEVSKIVKNNSSRIKVEDERGKFCIMWTGRMVAQLWNQHKIELNEYSPPNENDSKQIILVKRYFKKLVELLQLSAD